MLQAAFSQPSWSVRMFGQKAYSGAPLCSSTPGNGAEILLEVPRALAFYGATPPHTHSHTLTGKLSSPHLLLPAPSWPNAEGTEREGIMGPQPGPSSQRPQEPSEAAPGPRHKAVPGVCTRKEAVSVQRPSPDPDSRSAGLASRTPSAPTSGPGHHGAGSPADGPGGSSLFQPSLGCLRRP